MANCISNIVNTRNQQVYNPASVNLFKKETKANRVIQAPDSLYKYSLNEKIQEQDEFKKTVRYEQYCRNKKKKGSFLKTALISGIILLACAFLKLRKK